MKTLVFLLIILLLLTSCKQEIKEEQCTSNSSIIKEDCSSFKETLVEAKKEIALWKSRFNFLNQTSVYTNEDDYRRNGNEYFYFSNDIKNKIKNSYNNNEFTLCLDGTLKQDKWGFDFEHYSRFVEGGAMQTSGTCYNNLALFHSHPPNTQCIPTPKLESEYSDFNWWNTHMKKGVQVFGIICSSDKVRIWVFPDFQYFWEVDI